jgi:apolipoprotein N-acyltransferase
MDPEHDPATWIVLSNFVAQQGVPLLAGGPGTARRAGQGLAHFNSAHLITPGHGMRSYHKRWLVPLAERWTSFFGAPPAELASLEPGQESTVFTLGDSAFGVLICFEITDPAGARALVRGGARFIVNMTNDAWFMGAARPPHLPWAAVRAVETGVPVVRASNAGLSAVFDRFGRRVATSRPGAAPTILAARVPASAPTIYARTGDVFLIACAFAVAAGVGAALARRGHAGVRNAVSGG